MNKNLNRRNFIRNSTAAAAGTALMGLSSIPTLSAGNKPIRLGFIGIGSRGSFHLDCALGIEDVEVPAICDINETTLQRAKKWIEESGRKTPRIYGKHDRDYVRMCEKEELDAVVCCTSWEWHAPVCIAAMKTGKHAASEVPIALTVDEAWELVETSERTGKQAGLALEQGFTEKSGLFAVYNMVRLGLFGTLLHGDDGYLHDLRKNKFLPYTKDNPERKAWRLEHSITRNGNLYPDHPMSRIIPFFDINHGDRMDYLVSVSSKAVSLNEFAAETFGADNPYAAMKMAQGDYNASLIRTVQGKLISLNFDTNTPLPREPFRLLGTKGIFLRVKGIGDYIYLDGRSPKAHRWEPAEPYYKKYEHPMYRDFAPVKRQRIRGHGGGSTTPLTWLRFVKALREEKPFDYDVYDSVCSSVISPLTEESVSKRGKPVDIPDFTRGKWKSRTSLEYSM